MNYIVLTLAVAIGALLVLFIKPNKNVIRMLLAFSGAYLLSVTVLHLLPDVYSNTHIHQHTHHPKLVGILILVGILLQSVLESFSKGLEHGHVHLHSSGDKKFPWMLFISLCIHGFSEGLPIHHNDNGNLLWAIAVHKIPIAIVLTSFLLHSKLPKQLIFIAISFFALMSPLGYFLGYKIPLLTNHHQEITAFIIGVFLHISTIILFESNENHQFNIKKFTAILLGILLAILTL